MRLILVISAFLFTFSMTSPAQAYTATDSTDLILKLSPGFVATRQAEKTAYSYTMYYGRSNPQTGLQEKLMLKILKKPADKLPPAIVEAIYKELSVGNSPEFKVTPLTTLAQPNLPFSAWLTSSQSKSPPQSGVVMWIDGDSATMYMLAYVVNTYLSTPTEQEAAIAQLKSSFQICYNGKNCYTVQ